VSLLQITTQNTTKKMSLFRSFRTLRPILGAFKTTNKPLTRPFSISRPFFDKNNNSRDSIQKQETQGFDEPIPIRIHEVTPNPLPKSLAPTHPEDMENYWLTMPTLFERAVGSERAELLNPHIYDELLIELVDVENGVGSSIFNPIIIPSMGEPERVVGCMGECYRGDDIDYDSSEQQFWVMSENTFGVCDECGLFFYLASPKTISRMQIEEQLEEEEEETGEIAKLDPYVEQHKLGH
jgi:hypothetical protein